MVVVICSELTWPQIGRVFCSYRKFNSNTVCRRDDIIRHSLHIVHQKTKKMESILKASVILAKFRMNKTFFGIIYYQIDKAIYVGITPKRVVALQTGSLPSYINQYGGHSMLLANHSKVKGWSQTWLSTGKTFLLLI